MVLHDLKVDSIPNGLKAKRKGWIYLCKSGTADPDRTRILQFFRNIVKMPEDYLSLLDST